MNDTELLLAFVEAFTVDVCEVCKFSKPVIRVLIPSQVYTICLRCLIKQPETQEILMWSNDNSQWFSLPLAQLLKTEPNFDAIEMMIALQ